MSSQIKLCISKSKVNVYFVTKSGTKDDASKDLALSHKAIAEFTSTTEHLSWISEDDCLQLAKSALTNKNIFVLDQFEGILFDSLSSTEAIVLGPRYVLACHLTNDVVPIIASPIFTLTMRDVVACVSGIVERKRFHIHKLVTFMGGLFTKDLKTSNTHLITNTVLSEKYKKAAISKMKIMKEEWIFEMWSLSQTDNTSYTSEEFIGKYKIPIFYNLVITSTGLSEAVVPTVEYSCRTTDILICQPNHKSEKFTAAVNTGKHILKVDWVIDSVKIGYALPLDQHRISVAQASTSQQVDSPTIFRNLTFAISGFSEDNTVQLRDAIKDAGGIIIGDSTKTVDYLVIAGDVYNLDDVNYTYKKIVTDLWINDCLDTKELVELQYYHRPILLKKDDKPLQGLTIVLSMYISSERRFLEFTARALGAEVNDELVQKENLILICPTADGKKYNGAIKWKRPVVTSEWLLKCLDVERKAPLLNYLVGEAICGEDDENIVGMTERSSFAHDQWPPSFLDNDSLMERARELFPNWTENPHPETGEQTQDLFSGMTENPTANTFQEFVSGESSSHSRSKRMREDHSENKDESPLKKKL